MYELSSMTYFEAGIIIAEKGMEKKDGESFPAWTEVSVIQFKWLGKVQTGTTWSSQTKAIKILEEDLYLFLETKFL